MAGMLDVYSALVSTPHSENLVHIGSATLNAVRMEKAYRSGSEITNEVTITEADVARFSRDGGFQGADRSLEPATRWVLAYLRLDEPAADAVQSGRYLPAVTDTTRAGTWPLPTSNPNSTGSVTSSK
jgi:glycine cleavage system aminomethyltransferase T